MWRELPYSKPLFLSCTIENGYHIYITNYINIWWVHYSENEFLNALKKSNDDIEMESDNLLVELGVKMLLEPEKLKKLHVNYEDKALNTSMSLSCGFTLYLQMKLAKGSKEMFFKKITRQLLKIVNDLRTSEKELHDLLIKKDKEIEEYKNETDVRIAMYLKTGVFRNEEHMGKHTIYEDHFGTSGISKCLLEKVVDETEDQVIIKEENQGEQPSIKVEPNSQHSFKNEPDLLENKAQNLCNSGTVKRENTMEPHTFIKPNKKYKKLLKI